MFSAKDTLKVPMKRDKGLKKAAKNNLLFFAKRCRSRSFFNITQLTSEERIKEFDGEGENFFGYGAFGQRFEFTPQDYSIVSHYTDQKKLYEDMISPTVVVLTRCNETNKNVIKKSTLKCKLLSEEVRNSAKRECAIHSNLKHKNIIELYEYTENEEQYDLFLEHANKPTYLTDLIIDSHTPIEDQVELKHLAAGILEGLAYIHDQGIIHGDIKLDNMLCNEEDGVVTVKICDFGFSYICDVHKKNKVLIKDVSGTIGHIAPEVKHNSLIGVEVDMWCFGLILYEMAVAYKPTQVKNYSYADGEIPFRKIDWRRKSPELQDLITKCMAFNPEDRLTAEEALSHPWFTADN